MDMNGNSNAIQSIARRRHEKMEAMFVHQCGLIDANIVGIADCLIRRNCHRNI
jgi:hypothetical protein